MFYASGGSDVTPPKLDLIDSLLCLRVTICECVSGFVYSYTFDRTRLLHGAMIQHDVDVPIISRCAQTTIVFDIYR